MIIKKLSNLLKNILIWDHEERKHCSVSTGTPLQVILKVLKVNHVKTQFYQIFLLKTFCLCMYDTKKLINVLLFTFCARASLLIDEVKVNWCNQSKTMTN